MIDTPLAVCRTCIQLLDDAAALARHYRASVAPDAWAGVQLVVTGARISLDNARINARMGGPTDDRTAACALSRSQPPNSPARGTLCRPRSPFCTRTNERDTGLQPRTWPDLRLHFAPRGLDPHGARACAPGRAGRLRPAHRRHDVAAGAPGDHGHPRRQLRRLAELLESVVDEAGAGGPCAEPAGDRHALRPHGGEPLLPHPQPLQRPRHHAGATGRGSHRGLQQRRALELGAGRLRCLPADDVGAGADGTRRGQSLAADAAGFVAGAIFTFAPLHMAHLLGHMQVMSLEWIPFYVLFLLRSMQAAAHGRPWLRTALLAGLFLAFVGLCDWYFVLYLFFFTALTLVWAGVRCLWRWRHRGAGSAVRRLLPVIGAPVVAGAVFVLLLSPMLVPMVREATRFSFMVRPPTDLYVLSASVMDFLVPNRLHTLARPASFAWIGNQIAPVSERTISVGYVALILAVAGAWRGRGRSGLWVLTALFFFLMALGPRASGQHHLGRHPHRRRCRAQLDALRRAQRDRALHAHQPQRQPLRAHGAARPGRPGGHGRVRVVRVATSQPGVAGCRSGRRVGAGPG
ncbi:MAG: hypothetical protein H6644_16870 [Caldilineaceae bacterium]|nr:hypothetical protein [Caldilineaceae bacterium]